jgi:MSHA biogenesis protein MshI
MKLRISNPFKKGQPAGQLAIASSADDFLYAQADASGRLVRCGHLARGSDSPAAFARHVHALGLPPLPVCAVLPLAQAQLLQVEAPAVKADEMKAAARWRIKDQVEGRLDDYIVDVMFVGHDKPRPSRQLFVAAARSGVVRELSERCAAAGLNLAVIDLAETTQRNLHAAQARREGLAERATAALVQHGGQCLLTVCVGDELYYARRLEWDAQAVPGAPASPGTLAAAALAAAARPALAMETMDFVDYGAEPEDTPDRSDDAPRAVVELQRSFDVWERSWPDLPLARLWVQVGEHSPRLAALLAQQLGQPVAVLDIDKTFPELAQVAPDPALREALGPVLGLLLRSETRRL